MKGRGRGKGGSNGERGREGRRRESKSINALTNFGFGRLTNKSR